jgi:hypothetical protein
MLPVSKTVTAIFDGRVLRPDTPLDLERDKRYVLTIESEPTAADDAADAWDVLDRFAGTVDAPSDWASQHDHYFYGTPKRQAEE